MAYIVENTTFRDSPSIVGFRYVLPGVIILPDIEHAPHPYPFRLPGDNLHSLLIPVQVKVIIRQNQIFLLV